MAIVGIAIGGAIGSVFRYLLHVQITEVFGPKFPYGTLVVNISGSLLIGFLSILFLEKIQISTDLRLAIIVGLLGGFTTFSTFSLETLNLFQQGNYLSAVINAVLSVVLCIIACLFGTVLARTF